MAIVLADVELGIKIVEALATAYESVKLIVQAGHTSGGLTPEHKAAIATAVAPVNQHLAALAADQSSATSVLGDPDGPQGG